jgi:hypothetical protein
MDKPGVTSTCIIKSQFFSTTRHLSNGSLQEPNRPEICTKVSSVICFLCWTWILLLARIFLVDHATKPLTKILLWPERWHGFSNCRMPLHISFSLVEWFEWQWTLCKVYLKLDSSEIVSDLFCWERERSIDRYQMHTLQAVTWTMI